VSSFRARVPVLTNCSPWPAAGRRRDTAPFIADEMTAALLPPPVHSRAESLDGVRASCSSPPGGGGRA